MKLRIRFLSVIMLFVLALVAAAQPSREQKPKADANQNQPPAPDQEIETLTIDTNLVTVPVIANSRTGTYIGDLKKEEFKLAEDGVPQEIAFLASVNAPFYVVLMLDTSNSTEEKLPQIHRAAIDFLDQIGPSDKVKVISFDGELHDWNDFTSDKSVLRHAIMQTRKGDNTRVYDAVQLALNQLRPIQQRKAIVIFTDGMDWHSDSSTFDSTLHDLDESGVIVYPIRFETRAESERIARNQDAATNGVNLPTSSVLRTPPSGTTPSTFPSDDPSPAPAQQRSPSILQQILGRRSPYPTPTGNPNDPVNPFPDSQPTTDKSARDRSWPNPNENRQPRAMPNPSNQDSVGAMLDQLYFTADSYLKALADRSGGQLYRADTVALLPQAFAAIAAELRTQYLLGYYPTNKNDDGSYRKLQVKTTRKDIAIRARPGYRAKS